MSLFNSPDYKVIHYQMNAETGRYQKTPSKIAFQKLPFELKVERTIDSRIKCQGAETIITGRFQNKKREFFSGLRKTNFKNCFYGDDYEFVKGVKKNSIVIFTFSDNDSELTVYYFNQFFKDSPDERHYFVNNFIGRLNS